MKKLSVLLAITLFAGACTHASVPAPAPTPTEPTIAPKPTPAPVDATCAASGDVMFEIDHEPNIPGGQTIDLKLYRTGAWTRETTSGAPMKGCLAGAALATIADHLNA